MFKFLLTILAILFLQLAHAAPAWHSDVQSVITKKKKAFFEIKPSTVDFGSVLTNTRYSETIQITNAGTEDLEKVTVQLMGFDLEVNSNCPGTLKPKEYCKATIELYAYDPGGVDGRLEIGSLTDYKYVNIVGELAEP